MTNTLDRLFKDPRIWVGLLALGVISLYGGLRSSAPVNTSYDIGQETPIVHRSPKVDIASPDLRPVDFRVFEFESLGDCRVAVSKLIAEGIIRRINEPKRQLFINDTIWNLISYERKQRTVRVVGEYLDWVNDTQSGRVNVLSFKTGQSLLRNS